MPKRRPEPKALVWRNSRQIRGVRAMLTRDMALSNNGASVTIDLKTARNLQEVCDQAMHTEEGHG